MRNHASTIHWLVLLALTGLSASLAESSLAGVAVLAPVLIATLVKGRIVIDEFMALRGAPAAWRWVVLIWLLLVVGLIAYAFRISQN